MNSREKILHNIKQALKTPSHPPADPGAPDDMIRNKIAAQRPASFDGLVELFKKELLIVSGEFYRAASTEEAFLQILAILRQNGEKSVAVAGSGAAAQLLKKLPAEFSVVNPASLSGAQRIAAVAQIATAVVDVTFAIADSATLVVPFNTLDSTLPHFLPDNIIALVRRDQLIATHFELFEKIDADSARNMLLVTGPSRTADIEKILILGAHGPRRLVVIFMDE